VPLTLRAEGSASADLVWERYADLSQWSHWSPQVRRVESPDHRIGCGVTGSVVGPLRVRVQFVIDEVNEPDRRWVWRVRRGPVRLRLVHLVEEHAGGCSTTLVVDGPLPVAVAYAPLAKVALARLVRP
jgi:hypothetical protein